MSSTGEETNLPSVDSKKREHIRTELNTLTYHQLIGGAARRLETEEERTAFAEAVEGAADEEEGRELVLNFLVDKYSQSDALSLVQFRITALMVRSASPDSPDPSEGQIPTEEEQRDDTHGDAKAKTKGCFSCCSCCSNM